jgi:hypothetical protein
VNRALYTVCGGNTPHLLEQIDRPTARKQHAFLSIPVHIATITIVL